ncbi:Gfo/Idh/MocA family protein [Weissella cibaria]|uniref:Gfo/Idh/MocA family protein n=1 Tax=Weissella cibaria TaxID=137591 RepID=UPI001FD6ED6E|nr:Gfo/Idh/MocA family oxidoreductase [Weissella cibaria]
MSLNWGIISIGTIANEMAASLLTHQQLAMAVTVRDQAKLPAFAERYQIPKTYETVADLLADETIDAVYIAAPHNIHFDFVKQALAHHKHVLAEKAITVSNEEYTEEYTIVRKLPRIWISPLRSDDTSTHAAFQATS